MTTLLHPDNPQTHSNPIHNPCTKEASLQCLPSPLQYGKWGVNNVVKATIHTLLICKLLLPEALN